MLTHLNYLAVLVATLVYFIIGSVWFSVLFGKTWAKLLGLVVTEEDKKNMPKLFSATFVLNFVICLAVACVMHLLRHSSVFVALKVGLMLGVGFVAAPCVMNYMYSRRPVKLMAIDAGYHIISILVASVILILWH